MEILSTCGVIKDSIIGVSPRFVFGVSQPGNSPNLVGRRLEISSLAFFLRVLIL